MMLSAVIPYTFLESVVYMLEFPTVCYINHAMHVLVTCYRVFYNYEFFPPQFAFKELNLNREETGRLKQKAAFDSRL